jgi:hypothetical protein
VNWFLLLGHINHAAAPFANLLEEFVAANAVAGFLGENSRQTNRSAPPGRTRSCCKWLRSGRWAFEEAAGFFAGLQEFLDSLAQGVVASAGFVKIPSPLVSRQSSGATKGGQFALS